MRLQSINVNIRWFRWFWTNLSGSTFLSTWPHSTLHTNADQKTDRVYCLHKIITSISVVIYPVLTKRSEPPNGTTGICWCHQKYGAKTLLCTRPCTFSTSYHETQGNDHAKQWWRRLFLATWQAVFFHVRARISNSDTSRNKHHPTWALKTATHHM